MATRAELIEELRWKKFPVLDDGFVCLVDVMGDDQAVVQAARVSYGVPGSVSVGKEVDGRPIPVRWECSPSV